MYLQTGLLLEVLADLKKGTGQANKYAWNYIKFILDKLMMKARLTIFSQFLLCFSSRDWNHLRRTLMMMIEKILGEMSLQQPCWFQFQRLGKQPVSSFPP